MAETMTRAEHLAWCKERALQYADAGDLAGAISSIRQDLALHPETANSVSLVDELMLPLALIGSLDRRRLREFIEGFR